MTAGAREVVASRRSELAASMVRRLESEPGADLAWEASQLEALDKLLGALPVPTVAWWRRALAPMAVAGLCLVALGAAWTLRVDRLGVRTGVVLDAKAQAIVVTFAAPWELDGPIPLAGGVRLLEADLDVVGAPSALTLPAKRATLTVVPAGGANSRTVSVTQLTAAADTTLTVERAGAGQTRLAFAGAASGQLMAGGEITFELRGAATATAQTARALWEIPETLEFATPSATAVPMIVELAPALPVELRNLPIDDVGFSREVGRALVEQVIESTVEGGSLRLPAADLTAELHPGDVVTLEGFAGEVRELRVSRWGPIEAVLVGDATTVAVGPRGQLRDLTPTLLDYLYSDQRVALLVTAATFLWGALWSIRGLLLA